MKLWFFVLLSSFVLAANTTINSSLVQNYYFELGSNGLNCVNDVATGNSYCFTQRGINEMLSCPGFGVAPKYSYNNAELGVYVSFNQSICDQPVINNTVYPQAELIQVNKTIPLDVNIKLDYGECFINPSANASICAPDGKVNLFYIAKRGELYNDTNRSIIILVENSTDSVATKPAIELCGNGKCDAENAETPTSCPLDCPINPIVTTQPSFQPVVTQPPQDNAIAILVIAVLLLGGFFYLKNKQQGDSTI